MSPVLFPISDITLPIEPFISLGGGIIITMLTGGFGLLSIWLNKRLNRIDTSASKAAELAEPTGNGFALEIKETLARQDRTLGRIERELTTHGRDIGGIREEQRTERVERIALAHALSHHIERNDS
ncbi:hypothetical protein [Aeromicrobium sp.]|uniref:hypothetical protein n=1 Tax=Aeromicrobium sp. TaxID=1871063 RepID=UPI0030C38CAB